MQATLIEGMITIAGLLLGMVLFLETGRRIGLRIITKGKVRTVAGLGVVEGALLGLMGLVIAFTFSGAASRFDARRNQIVEEANDIGTAYLRIDLLPEAARPQLREDFRLYVDSRIETYRTLLTIAGTFPELDKSKAIQGRIWEEAIAATRDAPHPQAALLLLPSLNAMFDIANTRAWATQLHPPPAVFVLLGTLALFCSLLAGFSMAEGKARSWIHIAAFAVILTLTVYVILDMEYPRVGFIRVDAFDKALVDVRADMR